MSAATIAVLPGDGVGPEVVEAAVGVLRAVEQRFGHMFTLVEHLVGQAAIEAEGVAISDATFDMCAGSDAVLFGAVGGLPGAREEGAPRPEQALFRLRKQLGLFANLRPVRPAAPLYGATPLKPEHLKGTDMMFVRELSAGLYYGHLDSVPGKPSEIRRRDGGGSEAIDTLLYTEHEIERVVRVAFEIAARRRRKVTHVDKVNVLSSSLLWREVVERVAAEHPTVTHEHLLVDACAMRLIRTPSDFDVIVTENMFGDILTDEAAMLTGSVGMLPSASLGHTRTAEGMFGLYEPVHGSAPDIAGQDRANPIGAVLSAALMLDNSLGLHDEAATVEDAVDEVLAQGYRTEDIDEGDSAVVGTRDMGRRIRDAVAGR
jgi:3-isopropylmalate dehydrogenase